MSQVTQVSERGEETPTVRIRSEHTEAPMSKRLYKITLLSRYNIYRGTEYGCKMSRLIL
jgi:hypothetical protein